MATQVQVRVGKKAFSTFAFIGQSIEYNSGSHYAALSVVKLHQEYCIQLLSPHYRKEMDTLGRVQRSFLRMLPGIGGHWLQEEAGQTWIIFFGVLEIKGSPDKRI